MYCINHISAKLRCFHPSMFTFFAALCPKKGMACASVGTHSTVIMAKAKSRVSNCAEEESLLCSTLNPSINIDKEKKHYLAPSVLSNVTTAEPIMETTLHQAQMCVTLSVINEFIFFWLIESSTILYNSLMIQLLPHIHSG